MVAELEARCPLGELKFRHGLRRYQQEIIELVNIKLARGERKLHIVAPPGAGKTILGWQIISQFNCNTLVVCPNTTIQSQWGQKLDLFMPEARARFKPGDIIGNHEDRPLKPVTLLTYQVLSTPGREQEYLEHLARQSWVDEIVRSMSVSAGAAELRLLELMQNNPRAYQREMSRHISRLRRKLTEVMDLNDVLHNNALDLLQGLRRQKFQLVIFDECHHLTDYWAAVMHHLVKRLPDPVIVGLTGTPPEGKSASQENRYLNLVGEIDYQVPTPALVREGGLAPFQDLVFFTEPTPDEMEFLEGQHEEFHQLIDKLTRTEDRAPGQVRAASTAGSTATCAETTGAAPLTAWILKRVAALRKDNWANFVENKPDASAAITRFLWTMKLPIPNEAELSDALRQAPFLDDWMILLEDFALNCLKTSSHKKDHALYAHLKAAVRKLGYGLTEQGIRRQASPVDRVLAFSGSKPRAVAKILELEYRHLQDRLRAVVVTDFEQMSAMGSTASFQRDVPGSAGNDLTGAPRVKTLAADGVAAPAKLPSVANPGSAVSPALEPANHCLADNSGNTVIPSAPEPLLEDSLEPAPAGSTVRDLKLLCAKHPAGEQLTSPGASPLSAGQGGAQAVLRELLASNISFFVYPCLVTGSLLLVDRRVTAQFVEAARAWLRRQGYSFELIIKEEAGSPFSEITAGSSDWETRLYVGMATELFERGLVKCLIGTRGIFGEGWDSQSLNTLIDLTTTTSPVAVKQLRGRSLRLHTNDPLGAGKVANNWDVVTIAPALEKGLNDYLRFVRKHEGYFGVSDDGQIECGVGHVHPSLSELTPAEVFASYDEINNEMMQRAQGRRKAYELWKVGQPYGNKELGCVEIARIRKLALTPPCIRRNLKYKEHARQLRASLNGIWWEYTGLGSITSAALAYLLAACPGLPPFALLALAGTLVLARRKYGALYRRLKTETCRPNTQESSLYDIGVALLSCLRELKLLPRHTGSVKATMRTDGSYRIFLDNVEPVASKLFAHCYKELMAPVSNQPFLIPKYEYSFPRLTAHNGSSEDAFFKSYLAGRAEPRIAAYHALPKVIARSTRGRDIFQDAWNKYVSPGSVIATQAKPELLERYFGIGPSLSHRLIWS